MANNAYPVIALTDINKSYPMEDEEPYQALKKINLNIESGEFVAIMGPSGSGKSTLMHILGALDTATAGTYFLMGKEISSYSDDQLAEIRNKQIGFVFQSFNLLTRTSVLSNVERPMMYAGIPAHERTQKALDALKRVGMVEKAKNLSNKISGGQIQRVAIARALVMDPDIILADEPTGNLDSKTSHEIMNFFQEINRQGHTIIVITHENDIAAFAKRIIHIRDGEIISDEINHQMVGGAN
jgi:putative ABC transport system ATP-binding protein